VDTPVNGGQIWEINPDTNATSLFTSFAANGTVDIDQITFSPEGSLLYVANRGNNTVRAIDVANPGAFADIPGAPASGIDGISLGLGTLNGYMYLNYNDGTYWEIGLPGGPHAGSLTQIFSGGTRGDFTFMDPAVYSGGPFGFPSLLITQTSEIDRLDPPGGGFWVSNYDAIKIGTPNSPEPATWLLAAIGMTLLAGRQLRRRRM
jgi:YVTN family beta-propeller protein